MLAGSWAGYESAGPGRAGHQAEKASVQLTGGACDCGWVCGPAEVDKRSIQRYKAAQSNERKHGAVWWPAL